MLSIVFSANPERTHTTVIRCSVVTIVRNLGALMMVLYVLGLFVTRGASRARQEFSLVQRTYSTKLLTDRELDKLFDYGGDQGGSSGKVGAGIDDAEDGGIRSSLLKLLIARQRVPYNSAKARRLFAKGRKRVRDDLDITSQARNTQRIKAMSQVLLNDQQRMILSLNKRQLLEDHGPVAGAATSSEPMTDTADNSEGEPVTERIRYSV